MSELIHYFNIAREVIETENDKSIEPKFSPFFVFPFTDDYSKWINFKSEQFPPEGRKPRKFWNDFYGEIIGRQIIPAGVSIPPQWYGRLVSYPTNCVYMIADSSERLLYVGKCEYTPVIRLLDRLIPKALNPSVNNVPEIWDNFLNQAKKVKCVFLYDLSFDPEVLESFLLDEYTKQHGALPTFNKRKPKNIFYDKIVSIRAKMKDKDTELSSENFDR